MTDARQLVKDLLLLHAQLFLIGYLLPLTAATYAEVPAEGFDTLVAVLVIPDDLRLHERMFLAANLQVHHVARHRPGNEYHHVIDAGYRLSLGSIVGDEDVFQYG